MKKLLLGSALVIALNTPTLVHAHCSTCGEGENHAENPADVKHAAEKHVSADVIDTIAADEDFSVFITAIETAGLADVLKGDGPFTVLAPNNDAFKTLTKEKLDELSKPENRLALQALLKYHIIPGEIKAADIKPEPNNLTTLDGRTVKLMKGLTGVNANNANVIRPDITTSNGIIHVVDEIVMP